MTTVKAPIGKVYNFYEDPGHGWMKVTKAELLRLGIASEISTYSYQRGDHAYLEEDCDFSLFMQAKKARNEPVRFNEHHTDRNSKIRGYEHYRRPL